MNHDAGLNTLKSAFEALMTDELKLKIPLTIKSARSQLPEVVARSVSQDGRVSPPQETDDSLMIRIHYDSIDFHCTVEVAYLAETACYLIYKFPKLDLREEPTSSELSLMESEPDWRVQIEPHYARRRENQAVCRRVRDEIVDNISLNWNELLHEVGLQIDIVSLFPDEIRPSQELSAVQRKAYGKPAILEVPKKVPKTPVKREEWRKLYQKAVPLILAGKNRQQIARVLDTTTRTLTDILAFGAWDEEQNRTRLRE